jgi:hypothetical protein
MPESRMTSSVVYDARNRELRTVRAYFLEKGLPEDIMWEANIIEGARIEADVLLGHIIWAEAPAEPLKAPADCAGQIEWLNERIAYEVLHRRSVPLLRLAAS